MEKRKNARNDNKYNDKMISFESTDHRVHQPKNIK